MRIEADNSRLVGLGNIWRVSKNLALSRRPTCKDAVHHAKEHPVLHRMPRVFDDGDHVRPVRCHVHKVPAASVAELDSVHNTGRPDNVGDVANRGSAGRAEIENLAARLHEDVGYAAKNSGGKLRSERVPDSVLFGRSGSNIAIGAGCWGRRLSLHRYPLLALDRFARREIQSDKVVLLASRHEDARVPVGFLQVSERSTHNGAKLHTTTTCCPPLAPKAPPPRPPPRGAPRPPRPPRGAPRAPPRPRPRSPLPEINNSSTYERRNHLRQSHLRQSHLGRLVPRQNRHEMLRGRRLEELRDLLWERKPCCLSR